MDRNVVNTAKEGWLKLAKPNVDGRPSSQPAPSEAGPRPEVKKWTDDLSSRNNFWNIFVIVQKQKLCYGQTRTLNTTN